MSRPAAGDDLIALPADEVEPTVVVRRYPNGDPATGRSPGAVHSQVTASNRGRGAATVTGWGFQTPDGGSIVFPQPSPLSSSLPFAMPPGGPEGIWMVELDEVKEACQQRGLDYHTVRAWVRLGGGSKVFAKHRGIGIA